VSGSEPFGWLREAVFAAASKLMTAALASSGYGRSSRKSLECRERMDFFHPYDAFGCLHLHFRLYGVWFVESCDTDLNKAHLVKNGVCKK
jgi:hypothetical protein